MDVLPAYMTMHHLRARCLGRSEEGAGSLGTRVTGVRELTCGLWNSSQRS